MQFNSINQSKPRAKGPGSSSFSFLKSRNGCIKIALLFELEVYNERESLESKIKTLAQDDYEAEKCGGAEEDEGEGEGT
jgi:hypothetical protein